MLRMVPAVFVSKRNDEIAIARALGFAQASQNLGFDAIYDLLVERQVIAGKIGFPRGCLRDRRSEKKQEQSEVPANRGFHREISARRRRLRKNKGSDPTKLAVMSELEALRGRSSDADATQMRTINVVLKPGRWCGTSTRQIACARLSEDRRFALVRLFLLALLLPICFQGCAVPRLGPRPSATRDHAFIKYWPAGGEGKLRLAVKDNIDMKGEVTTAGSQYVAGTNRPAVRDARCLASARRGNVHIVGKTNLTEFALGTSGMNEYYGTPVNPLARHRIPGGSSSGSAVAVASGAADVAFGSDTAGSVRVPAACCGILGLKTTYGLVPLDGVFPLSPAHLDTIGPMAKDVPRLVHGMELLKPGFSAQYRAASASAGQITIGRLYLNGSDPRIDRALDTALTAKGFRLIRLDDRFKAAWNEAQTNGATVAIADGWLSN